MKFRKTLLLDIDDSKLDTSYWKRINSLTENKVHLSKEKRDIKKHLQGTDCLLVGLGIEINKEDFDNAPDLKFIGVLGTGYGRIDTEYAKKKGVVVCNVPGYAAESVAEFVFATILESIRHLEIGKGQAKKGNYSEAGFSAIEIKDKVFGVFGLGAIGSRVAEIALGFGADVRYWSRNRKKEFEKRGIKYEEVDTLIPKCDFISLNLAQTKETENFLDEARLQKIKKGAVVVNTAPMELVDIDALAKRLGEGNITFILDHSDEMSKEDLGRLSKYDNCVIYPPIAYVSVEAGIAKQETYVGNIENFLKGSPTNVVN